MPILLLLLSILVGLGVEARWESTVRNLQFDRELAWHETSDGRRWLGCLMAPMISHMQGKTETCPKETFDALSEKRIAIAQISPGDKIAAFFVGP